MKVLPKVAKLPLFKINLLIKKDQGEKITIKFLKWILASGRYLVIFVELLTISAFVFRYKLDSDLMDLQEQISQQKPVIESFKNEEAIIRRTQFQLQSIKQIKQGIPDFAAILQKFSEKIPQTIKLTSVNIGQTKAGSSTNLTMNGEASSATDLSYFIKSLQNDPAFTSINLANISFENQISFTVTGELKPIGGQKN